jgi:hypothetical protein
MGEVIQFSEGKPDKVSLAEACRLGLAGSGVRGRYSQRVREQAIKNVVAVADRWWYPTVSLNFTPQVDFTEEQIEELKRLCLLAIKEALGTLRGRVIVERLVHELQSANGRPRPRAA